MNVKINYQKELEKTLENIKKSETVPKLFLHSCCAPCSSYVLEYLSEYFEITVFYYNPNIYPKEEYLYRVEEQQKLISELKTKNPNKSFYTVNDNQICPDMKFVTLEKIKNVIENTENVVELSDELMIGAKNALEEMLRLAK